jgi:hypothetical protein
MIAIVQIRREAVVVLFVVAHREREMLLRVLENLPGDGYNVYVVV